MTTASTSTLLLQNKHAVIFGASGAIGQAVAKEFAAQGATVFLSGRRLDKVEQVAASIQQDGGLAYAAEVDALDEQAVHTYLERVVQQEGSIDILLNVMGPQPRDYGNQINTLDLPLEQFLLPLHTLVPSQFITARAAARHMVKQHAGVILFITAPASRQGQNVSAIGAAFGAMESLLRLFAEDLGSAGVRVIGIRTGAMPETRTIQQTIDSAATTLGVPQEQIVAMLEQKTLLGRLSTLAETARLAAFLASDGATTITGSIVNASSGMITD